MFFVKSLESKLEPSPSSMPSSEIIVKHSVKESQVFSWLKRSFYGDLFFNCNRTFN